MRDFTKLTVWERSHAWALDVHRTSHRFPDTERYELARQLRRAAFAVPTNIAEGSGHESKRQYAHYLSIAAGSASEGLYLLLAARDLGYLESGTFGELSTEIREIRRMLARFRAAVVASDA